MDGMRPTEIGNPLSDAFRQKASLNVQQNLAAMKSQKELEQDAAAPEPADWMEWAAARGKTAEPTRPERGGDPSRDAAAADLSSLEGGATVSEGDAVEWAAQKARSAGLLEEKDPNVARRKRAEARRKAEAGVPPEVLQASRQIVEGQMDRVKGPGSSLQGLKDVPEAARMQIEAEDFHPALEIHDTANEPIVMEDEAPEQADSGNLSTA